MTTAAQQELRFDGRASGTIDERFAAWARKNPAVLDLFERFAFEAIRSGAKRYSADLICARIRWHVSVETRGDDFRLNDHFTSRLARWFLRRHPEHEGFFELRELRRGRA